MTTKTKTKFKPFNKLPTKVSQKEFNKYINPYLSRVRHGPPGKISRYKIFNYILHVLYTGIQWREIKIRNHEIHWSNIYKWHNRWSKDGSYQELFEASVNNLRQYGKLDLSILHVDGSNTVAKKGGKELVIPDTNIRRAKKRLL